MINSLFFSQIRHLSRKTRQIPKAVREQVWIQNIGEKYKCKCTVHWCQNNITVFDFQVGHNVPKSKGGSDKLKNLKPICSRCNLSMGNMFTIDEWNKTFNRTFI